MIYQLKPIFIEKLWGGSYYSKLNQLKKDKIGEVVLFSTHLEYDLIILYEHKETLLKDVDINLYHTFIEFFPISIKLIDAKEDLSIQVHPDDKYASEHHQTLGKEEYWMILEAPSSSTILIGHLIENQNTLKEIVLNGKLHQYMNQYPIKKGDMFYIPANTVHAIQRSTRLLEIAQASILNFRVDDYQRLDDFGKLRPLHIKEALDVMTIENQELQRKFPNHLFTYDYYVISNKEHIIVKQSHAICIILSGNGSMNDLIVKEGHSFVIYQEDMLTFKGHLEMMLIYSSLSI
jgi:mannose-6-phosphate isomerase